MSPRSPRDRPTPEVYRSMAVHPDGFVERHQLDEIAALLSADNAGVGITTALRGAGGFGKTTLAQALAEDERVRRAYPDGVDLRLGRRGRRSPRGLDGTSGEMAAALEARQSSVARLC